MIDPKNPDRTACPRMLARGAHEETGGCVGDKCAAFRWTVLDPVTGSHWMGATYPTELAANLNSEAENNVRKTTDRPRVEVMGACGMVYAL